MAQCQVFGDDATLLPVDSEHSAVFQCLNAAQGNAFNRIILTASGGPFRTWGAERIQSATPEEALKHPTTMGAKDYGRFGQHV